MVNNDYIPLSYLNALEYCPRRYYWEYVLGEMFENEHIIRGKHLHETINQESTIQSGNTLIHRQQWVWNHDLKIYGIIDAVEEKKGQYIPLEYKKGRMAKHLNDHYQLCAAALCLENTLGVNIAYGEIFYHSNHARQKVEFTPELREGTNNIITLAHRLVNEKIPPPIDNRKKCHDCSLKNFCLPQEISKLNRQ